jgi:hypothetical protein
MERERQNRGRRLPPILPSLLVGAGLLIIGAGFLAPRSTSKLLPGKLVPKQNLLTWRSPIEKTFRTLAIDAAQATFELENIGGSPVRIVEAQSSCGCAIPELPETPIGPGEVRPFKVKAVPLQIGEHDASITLRTDSPASPEIVLRLHVIGSRRPPYMAQAKAELAFTGDSPSETREIIAYHVELAGSKPLPPKAKTNIPLLKLSTPTLAEERPYMTPESVSRKYSIKASLNGHLPPGVLTGDVSIIDPWDPEHIQTIRFHGEPRPPIRAIPSLVVINTTGAQHEPPITGILVLTNPPVPDLVAELDASETPPSSSVL